MTTSLLILTVSFVCLAGAVLGGMLLRRVLPEHHLNADSKDVVKLAIGILGTLCALVLSLLIISSRTSFEAQRADIEKLAANVILLDDTLDHYGPETGPARELLRRSLAIAVARIWHEQGAAGGGERDLDPGGAWRDFRHAVLALGPANDDRRTLQAQAVVLGNQLAQTRVLLFEQLGRPIPTPFIVILVAWLSIIFLTFGLFAPLNGTVITVLLAAALSVSAAIFLGNELGEPFQGLMQLSSATLRNALAPLPR
jgi:hypothetical protein